MRRRRNWCSQAKVRSTTQRSLLRPEPCSVARRAMIGLTPRRQSSRRVLVEVVAAVGNHTFGAEAGVADLAAHWPDAIDERQQLGDVIAVAASLGAQAGAVNRRGPGQPP